ncbi:hypothetical protein DIC82_19070 [Clostridium beijerinckii]|nr:hypothetical protein DIC82_19070 [Clostridium beijerinckii]
MKQQYIDQFEDIFKSESLRGERIHWKLNWFLYTIILIMSSFIYFIQGNETGKYGIILSLVNLFYNLFITFFIFKKKSAGLVSYFTMFLNVLSLTIYNYIDATNNSALILATTASTLLYPICIFLGSLRMDKYLIIWTSILSIISMDGLYLWFYNSFDPYIVNQMISTDILSQTYRTIYLIISGLFIYSVPISMCRILRAQERFARESFENKKNAQHDCLTGVYNRLYFEQHLSNCIQIEKKSSHKFALLFIDLNGFKQLNDTYGHDFGDFVLKSVAEDVSATVRENDLVARIDGDEFVIIMSEISEVHEVQNFSCRVLSAITRKRTYGNIELSLGASIGISLYPHDTENMKQLIKYADEAMYKVKKSGKEGIMFYNSINNQCSI